MTHFESKVNEMLLKQQGFDHPVFGGLRIIMKDDEPWFLLNDVLKALGYKARNSFNSEQLLFEDGVEIYKTSVGSEPTQMSDQEYHVRIINEGNLNYLIAHSQKKEAKDYCKWVFGEVLPQIRKNGKYVEGNSINGGHDMEEFAKEFTNVKPLNIGRNRLIGILKQQGVLTNKRLPTQKYIDNGYMTVQISTSESGHKSPKAVVTKKGITPILYIVKEHYMDAPHKDYVPNQLMFDFENNTVVTEKEFYN